LNTAKIVILWFMCR